MDPTTYKPDFADLETSIREVARRTSASAEEVSRAFASLIAAEAIADLAAGPVRYTNRAARRAAAKKGKK